MAERDVLAEIMSAPVVTVSPGQSVAEALRIMGERRIGAVVAVEDGAPVGMFTERDLVNRILVDSDLLDRRVHSVMASPVVTAEPETPIDVAFDLMKEHDVRRLPVVDAGRLVGIVTERDLMAWVSRVAHS